MPLDKVELNRLSAHFPGNVLLVRENSIESPHWDTRVDQVVLRTEAFAAARVLVLANGVSGRRTHVPGLTHLEGRLLTSFLGLFILIQQDYKWH